MKTGQRLRHEFVEFIPTDLDDGTVYVSFPYATVAHKCCCGCGHEVVTPLAPHAWTLTFNGESISLNPSIGNWSFACQSHYWIKDNIVRVAASWTKTQIEDGRAQDRLRKKRHLCGLEQAAEVTTTAPLDRQSIWRRMWRRISGV